MSGTTTWYSDHPCARCDKWAEDWKRLRADCDMIQEFWIDLGNEVLANAPDTYDGDEAADAIAVRYVRDLEATIARVRELAQVYADGRAVGLIRQAVADQLRIALDGGA